MQAAPAIHCLLVPLRQTAADHAPEALSHPYTRAGGAGPAPHCISKLRASSLVLSPLNSRCTSHHRWIVN
eukprot:1153299-Pelagomonas_calceolata.AAC.5